MSQAASAQLTAAKSPKAWATFILMLLQGLAADLWSKAVVFEWLLGRSRTRQVIVPGLLSFDLSTNPGIVFGINMPPAVVVLASILALAAVVYFFVTSPRNSSATHIALGMILAGALGNLYDRLFSVVQLPGRPVAVREVRDFINMSPYWPWVYNIADALLVVGVVILLVVWLAMWRQESRAARQDQA